MKALPTEDIPDSKDGGTPPPVKSSNYRLDCGIEQVTTWCKSMRGTMCDAHGTLTTDDTTGCGEMVCGCVSYLHTIPYCKEAQRGQDRGDGDGDDDGDGAPDAEYAGGGGICNGEGEGDDGEAEAEGDEREDIN